MKLGVGGGVRVTVIDALFFDRVRDNVRMFVTEKVLESCFDFVRVGGTADLERVLLDLADWENE